MCNQKGKSIHEYEAIKIAIGKVITQLDDKAVTFFYDKQSEELLYKVDDSILPISALSVGYYFLIWMWFDIAIWYLKKMLQQLEAQ